MGSVPYLNSVPLVRGVESQIRFAPPSELGVLLRQGELDAALMSITEALFSDRYDILDGIAVASLGEVKSVFLAHRKPLQQMGAVACDPASLTSVSLLKVLLAEQGLKPEFKTLKSYEEAAEQDFVLLIGNPAIDFLRAKPAHEIWDLGAAWYELTNLPFVYAAWTLRRGVENTRLRRLLREARDFGMAAIPSRRACYQFVFMFAMIISSLLYATCMYMWCNFAYIGKIDKVGLRCMQTAGIIGLLG